MGILGTDGQFKLGSVAAGSFEEIFSSGNVACCEFFVCHISSLCVSVNDNLPQLEYLFPQLHGLKTTNQLHLDCVLVKFTLQNVMVWLAEKLHYQTPQMTRTFQSVSVFCFGCNMYIWPCSINHAFIVNSLSSIGPESWLAVYAPNEAGTEKADDSSHDFEAVFFYPNGTSSALTANVFDDVCPPFGRRDRFDGFSAAVVFSWGSKVKPGVILASSSSTDVSTVARSTDGPFQMLELDEPTRAILPLSTRSDRDTSVMGLAIDFGSQIKQPPLDPATDDNDVDPVPILWMLNSDGNIIAWYLYNRTAMASGIRCAEMSTQAVVNDLGKIPKFGGEREAARSASFGTRNTSTLEPKSTPKVSASTTPQVVSATTIPPQIITPKVSVTSTKIEKDTPRKSTQNLDLPTIVGKILGPEGDSLVETLKELVGLVESDLSILGNESTNVKKTVKAAALAGGKVELLPASSDEEKLRFTLCELDDLAAYLESLKEECNEWREASRGQGQLGEQKYAVGRLRTKCESIDRLVRSENCLSYQLMNTRAAQLGPVPSSMKQRVESKVRAVQVNLHMLESQMEALRKRLSEQTTSKARIKLPTLEIIQRTIRNISCTANMKLLDLDNMSRALHDDDYYERDIFADQTGGTLHDRQESRHDAAVTGFSRTDQRLAAFEKRLVRALTSSVRRCKPPVTESKPAAQLLPATVTSAENEDVKIDKAKDESVKKAVSLAAKAVPPKPTPVERVSPPTSPKESAEEESAEEEYRRGISRRGISRRIAIAIANC